jgi:uncharacterized protein YjdB
MFSTTYFGLLILIGNTPTGLQATAAILTPSNAVELQPTSETSERPPVLQLSDAVINHTVLDNVIAWWSNPLSYEVVLVENSVNRLVKIDEGEQVINSESGRGEQTTQARILLNYTVSWCR